MNLKIGGSNVGKIMYGGQEFGGATKLEPGTILYMSETAENGFENLHLLSTTKDWSNIDGINVEIRNTDLVKLYADLNITGDDFKNLDIEKKYKYGSDTITVSRSIVDGEYRLNISSGSNYIYHFFIKAL